MRRIQLLLEQWQYEALRTRAQREGRSVSHLVREIVTRSLAPALGRRRLGGIEGVGEDAANYGRDHDRFLYGAKN